MPSRSAIDLDPTLFNFLFDVVGLLSAAFISHALAHRYHTWMAYRVKHGNGVHLDDLLAPPTDAWQWLRGGAFRSFPVFAAGVIGLLSVFLHPLSDLDLEFKNSLQNLGTTTVFTSLSKQEATSPPPPYALYGDLLAREISNGVTATEGETTYAFTQAVDSITAWASPFTTYSSSQVITPISTPQGLVTKFRSTDLGEPLVSMQSALDLQCSGSPVTGQGFIDQEFLPDVRIPKCNFASTPSNKVVDSFELSTISVVSTYVFPEHRPENYVVQTMPDLEFPSGNIVVGSDYDLFLVPEEIRGRAIDRDDYSFGRSLAGKWKIRFCGWEAETSSLSLAYAGIGIFGSVRNDTLSHEYIWVGYSEGGCLPGLDDSTVGDETREGLSCQWALYTECDLFPEDGGDVEQPPECYLFGADFTTMEGWQPGVRAAPLSVATMAKNRRVSQTPSTFLRLSASAPIAAAFAMGGTEQMDVQGEVVRPAVGIAFITFSVLPWVIGLLVLATFRNGPSGIVIPSRPWHFVRLGREEEVVPRRKKCTDPFDSSGHLVFGTFVNPESEYDHLGLGTSPAMTNREMK